MHWVKKTRKCGRAAAVQVRERAHCKTCVRVRRSKNWFRLRRLRLEDLHYMQGILAGAQSVRVLDGHFMLLPRWRPRDALALALHYLSARNSAAMARVMSVCVFFCHVVFVCVCWSSPFVL